jgi:uncharacterized membrane protein YgdD (TMEM256/DUF423 family)
MKTYWRVRVSATLAAVGVALGAFGAHGLKDLLGSVPNGMETWKTAVFYHLMHAVVMTVLALLGVAPRAWGLFLGGVLVFSGSLYAMVSLGMKWMGPVTPLGGVLLLAGWLTIALRPEQGR